VARLQPRREYIDRCASKFPDCAAVFAVNAKGRPLSTAYRNHNTIEVSTRLSVKTRTSALIFRKSDDRVVLTCTKPAIASKDMIVAAMSFLTQLPGGGSPH